VRPHRNDYENDLGKLGWKHTGTEYEHPDPAEDIKRGLIEPIGEIASEGNQTDADDEREPETGKEEARAPAKPAKSTETKRSSGRSTRR